MSDRINITNGKASIAYTGETPWHRLGQYKGATPIPIREIQPAAGQDFTVEVQPIFLANQIKIPSHRAVVRTDTGVTLGVVTPKYFPIQNAQCGEIADALIAEGGAFAEVAGVLDDGQRAWILLKLPDSFEVTKSDLVDPYFLLCWGHDGKHGVAGKLTPVRVVCHNTLTAAGFGDGQKWSKSADIYLRHRKGAALQIEEAHKALGLVRKQVAMVTDTYRALAMQAITDPQVTEYFKGVFPAPEQAVDETPEAFIQRMERWLGRQEALRGAYEHGPGSAEAIGTAWGAYNAITHYLDHIYPVTQKGEISQARTESILFGAYSEVRATALKAAADLVGS